ncbi:Transcription and mRNA export factor ENY2 [Vitis vinifera]|uniref:Transcription and mRNA export factor ENY2 n=1 Tax=Vitis vinifera TaxID=29760 RepID=A0A438JCN6_VITVI|nr:Transcription and mRNA export factor ENY2 [Vitis vinifera]
MLRLIWLIESGEKERLMELLRERLIECGWKDEMKALCRITGPDGYKPVVIPDAPHSLAIQKVLLIDVIKKLHKMEKRLVFGKDNMMLFKCVLTCVGNARAFVKKKGRNNVTVDDLVHVIMPKGRASIPDSVKAELLQRIRTFLVSAAV